MDVVPASRDRIDGYAELFTRTFFDDPMITWPLPSDGIEERVRRTWLAYGPDSIDAGWVWEAPSLKGMASWVPPGEAEKFVRIDERSRAQIKEITEDGGARYGQLWNWLEAHFMSEPHWYLDHIAVAPESQGKGVGSALVRFGLSRAARDGTPAFLETARERNVAIYEHLGFRVEDSDTAPDGGPRIWFMRWDPA